MKETETLEPGIPISIPTKESPLQHRTYAALATVLHSLASAETTPITVADSYLIDKIGVDLPDNTVVGKRRIMPSDGGTVPAEVRLEDYTDVQLPLAIPLNLDSETGQTPPIQLPDEYDETPLPALRLTFAKDGNGSRFNGEVMFFEATHDVSIRVECRVDEPGLEIDTEFYGFAHGLGLGSVWKAYTDPDGPAPALGVYEEDLSDELGRQMIQAFNQGAGKPA